MIHFILSLYFTELINGSPKTYLIIRAFASTFTSMLFVLVFIPKSIAIFQRSNLVDSTKGYNDITGPNKQGTPIIGGFVILLAIYISTLIWGIVWNRHLQILLLFGLGFAFIGALDDVQKVVPSRKGIGLTQSKKYFGQFLIALLFSGIFISEIFLPIKSPITKSLFLPLFENYSLYLPTLFPILIIIFLIFITNAVNITDGMDGLAAFPIMLMAGILGLIAYISGDPKSASTFRLIHLPEASEMIIIIGAIAGACWGFLWHNVYPAIVFMGDTGSLALGGLLGMIAVMLRQELTLLLAGGVFVVEALSSVIQSYIGIALLGRRIFTRAPLHHAWFYKGISETKITARFWLLTILFSSLILIPMFLRYL